MSEPRPFVSSILAVVHARRGPIRAAAWEDDEMPPELGALALELGDVLRPVTPGASFRQELAHDLAATARQKRSPQIVLQRPPRYRRSLLIGAAVSSAVSVAGLIAVLVHQRNREAAQRAS